MMAVSVTTRAEFSAGRPRRLFEIRFDPGDNGANYDVAVDGKWFVVPRSDQAPAPGEVHVVLNWFDEVTARARSNGTRHSGMSEQQSAARWERKP
jgi:hypothetical protein